MGTDEDGGGTIDVTNEEFDDEKSFIWSQQAKIDMELYHQVSTYIHLDIVNSVYCGFYEDIMTNNNDYNIT